MTDLVYKPIENHREAVAVAGRINELMDAPDDSEEGRERRILEALIFTYEQVDNGPIGDAETFGDYLRVLGLKQVDIADCVGGADQASKLVSGKRRLTVGMIAALHVKFGMPYDKLIRFSLQEAEHLRAAG